HAADEVVVVPGFAARDVGGRTVLLGRGGSDSTALFLAEALRATRCRLVKDVDGLYEWDPAREGPRPRRYASLGYADALRTDGTIVQHKAIERAWSLGVAFEVAGLGRRHRTVVGASTVLASEEDDEAPRPLRVSLLGRGTVGAGVEALVAAEPERFELGPVLVRDVAGRPAAERLTADGEWAVAGAEVVVEALGGVEPARTLVARALAAGAHVVTANKALIAEHGPELLALARASGVRLLCSASVGGCMPLLERIPSGAPVRRVRGVLNGTVNAVLDSVARGASFERAVASAQAVGLAESDPTRDLDGRDAADKLAVIACALGAELDPKSVRRESLDEAVVARARDAAQARGSRLRQVSTLWLDGDVPRGSVGFEECAPGTALGSCVGPGNAALVERDDGSLERVAGIGAGRWPTAEAVLGDLHALARETPRRNPARATG
ncbi:MAG: aspartate kinase, partial [Planctomycetota bacterium]